MRVLNASKHKTNYEDYAKINININVYGNNIFAFYCNVLKSNLITLFGFVWILYIHLDGYIYQGYNFRFVIIQKRNIL